MDVIVTWQSTSIRILAIVQEKNEKILLYHMYDWKTSGLQKHGVFSNVVCAINSNFAIFMLPD